MRSVTSRNTPIDFESVQSIWDEEPTIDPGAIVEPGQPRPEGAGAPRAAVDLDGRIHLRGPGGDIDLIGQNRVLRIEINRGADTTAADRFLSQFADSSSPLWPLARALSIAVDLAVDGSRIAFYDASSPDADAPPAAPEHDGRPGTDRRLDADEPYGDWTYVDPEQLAPDTRGSGSRTP